jgi:vacuolar iron transporter family protein
MSDHFKGKSAYEHLKEARCTGAKATSENHGTEAPGSFAAAIDSARDMGMILALTTIVLAHYEYIHLAVILGFVGIGYAVWKVCRSALLGWARFERLHRLIEQERWEIEHHRDQEREELMEMYKLKGFTGKLLDDSVEVLMADDNRLLLIMLEEELGLKLCSFEHPLKQAFGALIGSVVGFAFIFVAAIFGALTGMWISFFILYLGLACLSAKREGNHMIKAAVWNLATGFFSLGILYFILELVHG